LLTHHMDIVHIFNQSTKTCAMISKTNYVEADQVRRRP
jgi:hypothetical protein